MLQTAPPTRLMVNHLSPALAIPCYSYTMYELTSWLGTASAPTTTPTTANPAPREQTFVGTRQSQWPTSLIAKMSGRNWSFCGRFHTRRVCMNSCPCTTLNPNLVFLGCNRWLWSDHLQNCNTLQPATLVLLRCCATLTRANEPLLKGFKVYYIWGLGVGFRSSRD